MSSSQLLEPRHAPDRSERAHRDGIGPLARHRNDPLAVRTLPRLVRPSMSYLGPALSSQSLAHFPELLGHGANLSWRGGRNDARIFAPSSSLAIRSRRVRKLPAPGPDKQMPDKPRDPDGEDTG